MSTQVIMPKLGESVLEGTITKWLKAKGESVEEYEPLLEVNTDKVDTEVPSPATGILLDIMVPENTTVRVGDVLALIGATGETQGSQPPVAAGVPASAKATPEGVSTSPARQPAAGGEPGLGFISPVVAKIAAEQGIDLAQVKGTGLGGRITKKDVLAHAEIMKAGEAAEPLIATSALPTQALHPLSSPPAPSAPAAAARPGEILPLTQVRRVIAEHMVLSRRTSPHVTTVMEADLSRVIAHRQANKDSYARDGVNLTFTAYFVAASVVALKALPIVNASWSEEGILLHKDIHIGVATSLGEAGLIVPVIKNADSLSLLGLARMVNDLANRARARQLKPDEVQGGTFTITNHGISGSLFATPIINQPQCAILGVGAIQKRVVVISDEESGDSIAIRPMAYLTLTFDHRILDGAIADTFLGNLVNTLQKWG